MASISSSAGGGRKRNRLLRRNCRGKKTLFYLPRVEKGGKGPLMTGGKSLEGRRQNTFASARVGPCEKNHVGIWEKSFRARVVAFAGFLSRFASTRGGRMSVAKDKILPPSPPFHFSLSLDHPRCAPPHTLFPTLTCVDVQFRFPPFLPPLRTFLLRQQLSFSRSLNSGERDREGREGGAKGPRKNSAERLFYEKKMRCFV